MEYTKGQWKLDFSIDRFAGNLEDPSRYIKEKEDGIFNDLVSLDGDTVMEYYRCGSHQMQIHKEGDRILIENAAKMYEWLAWLWDASIDEDISVPDDMVSEINNFFGGLKDGKN